MNSMNSILAHCAYHEDHVDSPRDRIRWWDGSLEECVSSLQELFEQIGPVRSKEVLLRHLSELHCISPEIAGICIEQNGKILLHLKKRIHAGDATTILLDLEELNEMCEFAYDLERVVTRRWWKITAIVASASALAGWWWGRRR